MTEWHNADELVKVILDCGGKRSATPLSDHQKSRVALHLPPQSKTVHWQSLIVSTRPVRSNPPRFPGRSLSNGVMLGTCTRGAFT